MKICFFKLSFNLIFVFFALFPLSAQTRYPRIPRERPFWFVLEEGKKAFREGEYGAALALFEEARTERRDRYTRFETIFISLLSIGEVRRIGDTLEVIEKYIEERNQFDSAAALEELIYRVGRDALRNSAKTALEYFGRLKEYPEAEFWIGEVYRLEGETAIAIKQYRKALEVNIEAESAQRALEVRYKIAELLLAEQNWTQLEAVLNEIIQGDTLWNASDNFVRNAMTRTLEGDGINAFLKMYRYRNDDQEKAHRMLGEFCYKSGRYILAESHLAFAVLAQSTVIVEEAVRRRFDFEFTTLENLAAEISRRGAIKDYIVKVDYYRTLYFLGAALYANGKAPPARGVWSFVAGNSDAGEWGRRAQNQLRAPFVESLKF
ncbi:MAG: hypothetical protein LBC77_03925 [Spirochaetaceae bacterium]|jgi:tetratricopeptide (TPR) repeat protein|nr:hypothetical protein [Spirochaetaceae bacterium]